MAEALPYNPYPYPNPNHNHNHNPKPKPKPNPYLVGGEGVEADGGGGCGARHVGRVAAPEACDAVLRVDLVRAWARARARVRMRVRVQVRVQVRVGLDRGARTCLITVSAESGVSLTMILRRMTSSGATIVLDTVAAIAPDSRCTRASLESSLYHARRTTTPMWESPSGSVGYSAEATRLLLCTAAGPPARNVAAVISAGASTSSIFDGGSLRRRQRARDRGTEGSGFLQESARERLVNSESPPPSIPPSIHAPTTPSKRKVRQVREIILVSSACENNWPARRFRLGAGMPRRSRADRVGLRPGEVHFHGDWVGVLNLWFHSQCRVCTASPRLVRVRRTYRAWSPVCKLPCAFGTYSTQEPVRVVEYGGTGSNMSA